MALASRGGSEKTVLHFPLSLALVMRKKQTLRRGAQRDDHLRQQLVKAAMHPVGLASEDDVASMELVA